MLIKRKLKKFMRVAMRILPAPLFIRIKYFRSFKKFPDLKNPKTYNEKLQWLKLHDKNPEYTKLVDKYEVREFVKERIGEEHLIPLIGLWNSEEEIDFDKLPEQFVIKCTHTSGVGIHICKDKSKLDVDAVKKDLKRGLKQNYYWQGREWPYKNIKPRVLAEKFMVDESGTELKDYKFFCFDGKPEFLFIATGRPYDTRFDFYDVEFNHLPFTNGHPNADYELKKPEKFEEMIEIASKLSKGLKQSRIDLYNINGKIYFGEITFFHWDGYVPFEPEEWDYKFGEYIKL